MHKFIKQHKDFAIGDEAKDLSKDYLQAHRLINEHGEALKTYLGIN